MLRLRVIKGLARFHALWILGVGCLCLMADNGWGATVPGRVVKEYALTSSHDFSYYDPRDWRLLGSTDGGASWTTIDVQTNQFFGKRNQRRAFTITNNTAYSVYRLKIDSVNSDVDDPTPEERQAQLAELELIGPIGGITN